VLIAARAGPQHPPLLAHSMDTAGPSDFRLVRVPSNRNPPSPRPVHHWDERAVPRFFGVGRGPIPAYSDASYWEDDQSRIEPPELLGHIAQSDRAEGTIGYWEAASGIANDAGVMIGESTCSAIFGARLCGKAGGAALLGYMELTRIALERCSSAREAVQLMGALAVKHGFAGLQRTAHTRPRSVPIAHWPRGTACMLQATPTT
jgi:dipeptidase